MKRNTFTTFKPDSVAAGVGTIALRWILHFVTGGYFYYGPDNFLTSRSYPAGYGCAVGGYLCEGIVLCVTPAISLAQDRESSPARTGGLATMLRNQLVTFPAAQHHRPMASGMLLYVSNGAQSMA